MVSKEEPRHSVELSGPYDNTGTALPDEATTSLSVEEPRKEALELQEPSRKEDLEREKLISLRKINCLRVSLILYNLIFIVISVVTLALGIYLLVSGNDVSFTISTFLSGSIIVIVVGLIILGLSIFGIIAVFVPKYLLLLLYALLMLFVFAAEIAIGVWGFVNQDDIVLNIREEFQFGISIEYGNDNLLYVSSIDAIQDTFDCCGYYGYLDWDTSTYLNSTFSGQNFVYYPSSCCDSNFVTFNGENFCNSTVLRSTSVPGCKDKVNKFASGIFIGVGVVGVILAMIQTIGILMTLFLSCYKSKYRDIKLKVMPTFSD